MVRNQPPVPSQQRRRRHDERGPRGARQQPTRRREEHSVGRPERRPPVWRRRTASSCRNTTISSSDIRRPEPKADQLQHAQERDVANGHHGTSSKRRKGPFILRGPNLKHPTGVQRRNTCTTALNRRERPVRVASLDDSPGIVHVGAPTRTARPAAACKVSGNSGSISRGPRRRELEFRSGRRVNSYRRVVAHRTAVLRFRAGPRAIRTQILERFLRT